MGTPRLPGHVRADPQLHLRLGAAVAHALFWVPAGQRLEQELRVAVERDPPLSEDLADAIEQLGQLRAWRNDRAGAHALLQRAAASWRELGEQARAIDLLVRLVELLTDHDSPTARQYATEARDLADELGDRALIDLATMGLAQLEVAAGDPTWAEGALGEMLARGIALDAATWARHMWADCALLRGDGVTAFSRYADAIRNLPQVEESPQVAFELQGLAMGLALAGRAEAAIEVDRIATAVRDHFELDRRSQWWERLREQHLGAARAPAVPSTSPPTHWTISRGPGVGADPGRGVALADPRG